MLIREILRVVLASMLHRLKTVKVGGRIAELRISKWICGEGVAIAKLRYGAQAVVFVNDYLGRSMYLWGEYDPRINAVADAVLRKGDTALDIGANLGVTGIFASKCVGPTGTVHLFEPQPLLASCLRTSLLINGYSHSFVHECALSDHSGQAKMEIVDSTNWGRTRLSSQAMEPSQTIGVRIENAGEYLISLGCARAALIKLDVEGHEAVILSSIVKWLHKACTPVILFECHWEGNAFEEMESVRILSGLGYEFLGIDRRPYWRTRLNPITEEQRPSGYDFVAVRWHELDQDRRAALEAMVA
jgi:FkbM family methyltransferase